MAAAKNRTRKKASDSSRAACGVPHASPPIRIEPRYRREEVTHASVEYFGGDELAASTFLGKYALQSKAGSEASFAELTPADMHDRLAREFARIDAGYPNARPFEEFRGAIDHFRYVVPQGSPMYGIGNPFARVSLSNCVVVKSPEDNVSGIMETGKELANLFKRRCGVGVDISSLRPDGAPVSNAAGTSTGAWSFADYFSTVCRMIGQNGRRGALMITMDVRHPDIERFTRMKRDLTKVTGANISIMLTDDFMRAVEEDEDWVCRWPVEASAAEARFTHTVRARELWHLINESAVLCAEPGLLFWDNYLKNLPAQCYPEFKTICVNPCSEIGLSAYDSCRLISLNLKSFVKRPFTSDAFFDFDLFEEQVRLGMRMMDDMVDLEIEHLTDIIDHVDEPEEKVLFGKLREAAVRGRRTGLGSHGLGDALACLTLRYDSAAAVEIVDRIFERFRDAAYDESVTLAVERGAFEVFDWNLEKECAFIQRLPEKLQARMAKHGRRNISLLTMAPTGSVSILSQTSSGIEPVFMNFYTRRKKINPSDRNARVDFVDQNGDHWEEFPVFHHNVKDYLRANPVAMAQWGSIRAALEPARWASAISEILPEYFVTAMEIDPRRRVEIQGVIQKYIDHGISSTINMPAGTTIEQGEELYHMAWKHGLKGVTIYVDGSRSGVLVGATTEKKTETKAEKKEPLAAASAVAQGETTTPLAAAPLAATPLNATPLAPPVPSKIQHRPRRLSGTTYKIHTPVGEAFVTINSAEEGAFELFVNIAKAGSTIAADAEAIGRLCSLVLRMPTPYSKSEVVRQIIRQLEGIGGERTAGLGKQRVRSLGDAVAQVLREHLEFLAGDAASPETLVDEPGALNGYLNGNGHSASYAAEGYQVAPASLQPVGVALASSTVSEPAASGPASLPVGDICPECGHATLVHEDGCNKCYSCAYSEC